MTTDCGDLIADPAVDAVIIATPVSSHYELAMRALRAGKHVMVTKPITAEAAQAMELIDEAEQRGLVLMVDHTFVYTGAVQTIKQVVESGNLGELYYYDSVRVNLGLFQKDVNVLWDLAVHDLSIMDYVLAARPVAVAATGLGHVPGKPENIAHIKENSHFQFIRYDVIEPLKVSGMVDRIYHMASPASWDRGSRTPFESPATSD